MAGPLPAYAAELPKPGTMVHLSPSFNPPVLKGIKVHPENPFRFDFILDRGSLPLVGRDREGELKAESTKLIKYFLASLTIPEKDLWVNLSPYEKDRIVPNSFGQTEMGRDLLAQDYMLKQITASLIYPEDETGKKFWKRIYEESARKFGTTNIPVNTFNKVWIVPEKAVVYENAEAGTAYVVESRLKVMLEEDYLALNKHDSPPLVGGARGGGNTVNALGSQIIREIVIPQLTKEINEGKNFAQLRQVYNSLILATWYKKKIKESIFSQVYADKNKTTGLTVIPAKAGISDVESIYQRYLQAFKKGTYNYIKEEIDPATQQLIPRKYFSGGVEFNLSSQAMVTTQDSAQISRRRLLTGAFELTVLLTLPSIRNSALAQTPKQNVPAITYQKITKDVLLAWAEKNGVEVQFFNREEWLQFLREKNKPLDIDGYFDGKNVYLYADKDDPRIPMLAHETLHAAHRLKKDNELLLTDLFNFKTALLKQKNPLALKAFYNFLGMLHQAYNSESAILDAYLKNEINAEEAERQLKGFLKLDIIFEEENEPGDFEKQDIKRKREQIVLRHILTNALNPNYQAPVPYSKAVVEKEISKQASTHSDKFIKGDSEFITHYKPGERLADVPKARIREWLNASKAHPESVATEFFAYLITSFSPKQGLQMPFLTDGRPTTDHLFQALKDLHAHMGAPAALALARHFQHFDFPVPESLREKISGNRAMVAQKINPRKFRVYGFETKGFHSKEDVGYLKSKLLEDPEPIYVLGFKYRTHNYKYYIDQASEVRWTPVNNREVHTLESGRFVISPSDLQDAVLYKEFFYMRDLLAQSDYMQLTHEELMEMTDSPEKIQVLVNKVKEAADDLPNTFAPKDKFNQYPDSYFARQALWVNPKTRHYLDHELDAKDFLLAPPLSQISFKTDSETWDDATAQEERLDKSIRVRARNFVRGSKGRDAVDMFFGEIVANAGQHNFIRHMELAVGAKQMKRKERTRQESVPLHVSFMQGPDRMILQVRSYLPPSPQDLDRIYTSLRGGFGRGKGLNMMAFNKAGGIFRFGIRQGWTVFELELPAKKFSLRQWSSSMSGKSDILKKAGIALTGLVVPLAVSGCAVKFEGPLKVDGLSGGTFFNNSEGIVNVEVGGENIIDIKENPNPTLRGVVGNIIGNAGGIASFFLPPVGFALMGASLAETGYNFLADTKEDTSTKNQAMLNNTLAKIRNVVSVFLLSGMLAACSSPLSFHMPFNNLKDKQISLVGHRHALSHNALFSFYDNFNFKNRDEKEKQELLKLERDILYSEAETQKEYQDDLRLLLKWLKEHKGIPGGAVVGMELTPDELRGESENMPILYPKIRKVLEYFGETDVDVKAKERMLLIFRPPLYAQYFHLNGENFKIVGLEGVDAKKKGTVFFKSILRKSEELLLSMNFDLSKIDPSNPDSLPEEIKILKKSIDSILFLKSSDVRTRIQELQTQLKLNSQQKEILQEMINSMNNLLENMNERNEDIVDNIKELPEKRVLLIIGSAHIDNL